MKRLGLLILSLMLIGLMFSPVVQAETGSVFNEYSTDTNANAMAEGEQHLSFYANGRYWVFYFQDAHIYYNTTLDLVSWTAPGVAFDSQTNRQMSMCFDGTYFHYVRYRSSGDLTYYRRGLPNADGSITWSAAEQTVYDGDANNSYKYPVVEVDSNGHVWVGAIHNTASGTTTVPAVLMNDNTDGTWSTASGFPQDLNPTDASYWRVYLARMNSGRMYIVYGSSEIESIYPQGRLWNGTTLGAAVNVTTTYYVDYGMELGVTSIGDDVYLGYYPYVGHAVLDFVYQKYTYSNTSWSAPATIGANVGGTTSSIRLSSDAGTNTVYAFWGMASTDMFYTANYTAGSWGPYRVLVDESGDTLPLGTGANAIQWGCWPYSLNGEIGVYYPTKAASPYTLKLAVLTVASGPTNYNRGASGSLTLSNSAGGVATPYVAPSTPAPPFIFTDPVVSSFAAGDVTGGVAYIYTSVLGAPFFGLLVFFILLPIYFKTQSVVLPVGVAILLSGLFSTILPPVGLDFGRFMVIAVVAAGLFLLTTRGRSGGGG